MVMVNWVVNWVVKIIEFEKWCVSVSFGVVCFGVGWWIKGHWKRFDGWLNWYHGYYDGNWFGWRLGPFFYCVGPY